jgi:hypothetical protein
VNVGRRELKMKKEEAIAEPLDKAEIVRHHTITKIRSRRQYRERHKNMSIDILLDRAKRDFLHEIRLLNLIKNKIENDFGQSIGPVSDQDGRII